MPQTKATSREKSHLESKKFVAFLWANVTWTGLIVAGLFLLKVLLDQPGGAAVVANVGLTTLLLSMAIIKGFLEAGYIGTQAWLDRYVRVAEITTETIKKKIGDDDKPQDPPTDPPTT